MLCSEVKSFGDGISVSLASCSSHTWSRAHWWDGVQVTSLKSVIKTHTLSKSRTQFCVSPSSWSDTWSSPELTPSAPSSHPCNMCGRVTLDTAILRTLWICWKAVHIQTGGKNIKKLGGSSGEPLSDIVTEFVSGQQTWCPQWDTLLAFEWQTCLGSDLS